MFEDFSYLFFQEYWWIIISLLGGILVFLFFVQGGQTLVSSIAANEDEKTLLYDSLGKKWELTFTTLVTFGGAIFAAFPKLYAVSFGGAYWLWMLILFCFIIQAVSYNFRLKPGNFLGQKTYEFFLYINGSLGVFLIGIVVGTFFCGNNFSFNEFGSTVWNSPLRGIEAIFNYFNLCLGFSVFFLARVLASLYFINNIDNEKIIKKASIQLVYNSILFLFFFLSFLIMLLLKEGVGYNSNNDFIIEKNKYLSNLLQLPLLLLVLLTGISFVLTGVSITIFKKSKKGIWFSGLGTVFTVFVLLLITGLNNTSIYPSISHLQSSLSIINSSSTKYTLTTMTYVSFIIPFVICYIFIVWRKMNKKTSSNNNKY